MPRRRKDKDGKEVLTVREQLFVEGVAQGKSLTQAALEAGYSSQTAYSIGQENLTKPEIQQAVRQRIQDTVKADTDEVLSLLAAHLRADIADFDGCFTDDGRLDLKEAKSRRVSRLVKKLKNRKVPVKDSGGQVVDYEFVTEIEFHDSQAAARTLADIMGIKQMPRENDHDVKKRRDWAESKLGQVMERLGLARPDAIEWMQENTPQAAQWIH